MKKIFYSIMALAIAAMTFQSCEDVPMPYDMPEEKPTEPETPEGVAEGDGTLANPFNAYAAIQYTSALDADVNSTEEIYIKGKIVSIEEEYTTNYGNGSYTISEDGTDKNTFKVWRALYLGNKKFTSADEQVKVGDDVVVCGKVVNYKGNTPETVQGSAYLYSLNGKTASTETPVEGEAKGTGTKDDPFNSVAANKEASKLDANAKSEQSYYIKGKVVSVKEQFGTQYGNASFYISDDGTEAGQFYAYRILYLGNQKYTAGELLNIGDEVVIYGKLTNYYGNTPETAQGEAYLYSLNGKTEPTGGDNTGGDNTGSGDNTGGSTTPDEGSLLSNGGFESWTGGLPDNWKSTSTASSATLSQSTDAHGGSYSVCVKTGNTSNKRIAYKETELKAGTYVFTFYAKATTSEKCQVRPGYVPVEGGSVGNYVYGDYASITTGWTLVTYEFTLEKDATVCLVVMNPKGSSYATAQDVLIDDAKLVKK